MPESNNNSKRFAQNFQFLIEKLSTTPVELGESNVLAQRIKECIDNVVDPNRPVVVARVEMRPIDALTEACAMGYEGATAALKQLMKHPILEMGTASASLEGLTPLQYAAAHGNFQTTSANLLPIILSADNRSNPLATAHGDDPALHGKTAAELVTNSAIKPIFERAETLARALQTGSQANSASNAGLPNLKPPQKDRFPD